MIKFKLIPKKQVGPFIFGSDISKYSNLPLVKLDNEYDQEVGWISYKLKNRDVRLYVENNQIISIACYDECIFKVKNLIGLKLDKLKKIINKEPDKFDQMELDSGLKEVYDFDSLAIQVYVKSGKINSITCSNE